MKNKRLVWLAARTVVAATFFIRCVPTAHNQAPASIDVAAIGPAVGAKVPDFKLVDQEGRGRSLESVMGPRGIVLVFFRSADW